jgi:alpha-2-macroglobulin
VIDGGLKRLAELQQPDGGWAWNGHAQTHEMITPYVVWGLLRAERAGYKPADPTSIDRGLARIRELIQGRGDDQLSDRTYLMYVYAQKHPLPSQWYDWLLTRAPKLSDYALALALEIALIRNDRAVADQLATTLRGRAVRDGTGTHWKTGAFSRWMEDPFETTAVALGALVARDPSDPMLPEVLSYFITNKRGDRWNSTKDTAMILYAMTRYLSAKNITANRDAAIEVSIDGKPGRRLAFSDGLVRDLAIDGSQLSQRTTVSFANASPGVMVRAVLHYRTSGRNLAPMASGLAVERTVFLLGAGGKRVKRLASGDQVPRGSYVESVVKVDNAQRETMRYLLIEDPKPAGAEALPVEDKRFPQPRGHYVLREDRGTHLAFHHEQAPTTTEVRTILHLESSGDLAFVPASAELMYATQTRGHSGSFGLRVE